jgi:hypothetical protein
MLVSGCWDSHGLGADAAIDAATPGADAFAPSADAFAPSVSLVWVLVHPTDAPPSGPSLLLFDEVSQTIVRRLPLPDPDASVHGLAWDGRSLWLSAPAGPAHGTGGAGIFQLDPADGRVVQQFDGIRAEGVAADGDTIWYAGARPDEAGPTLVHLASNGLQLSFVPIPEPALVQDLAVANGALYYLANDDQARIMRIDPSSHYARGERCVRGAVRACVRWDPPRGRDGGSVHERATHPPLRSRDRRARAREPLPRGGLGDCDRVRSLTRDTLRA